MSNTPLSLMLPRVAGIFALMITACASAPTQTLPSEISSPIPPAATTVTPPRMLLTTQAAPAMTATDEYEFADQFGDGYIARISVDKVENMAPEDILKLLVLQWLEHYKMDATNVDVQLDDYKLELISRHSKQSKPRYDLVAEVVYLLKISSHQSSNWLGGCAELQEDGWVRRCDIFGVFRDGENYRLRLMPGWGT